MGREHWVECLFGDVVKIKHGYAFKTKDFKKTGDVPIIKQTQLDGERVNLENCVYVDKHFLKDKSAFILKKGDVLLGMSGSLGKFCEYDLEEPALQNQRVGKIEPISINHIENRFYWYYLHTIEIQLKEKGKGLAVSNVSADDIEALPFPLPPLNEQQRIVAKLDALLPKVKHAQARLTKISGILKKFRQSVLATACSGRLTEKFRQNDEYSDEDIPISWNRYFLPKVLESKPKNGYSGKPVKYETNTKVLSLTATTSGVFNDQYFKYLDELIPENSPFWVKTNDILIQRGNTLEYVGVPAIYKGKDNRFIYSDLMIRLVADKKLLMPDYLYYYLSWEKIRNFMRNNASGTAGSMPKINQRVLEKIIVFLPPLEEQHEIVRRVEQLFALADSLEAKYSNAMQRVAKIEQALLAKAFRGELAPPAPNDEPAEALLNRILTEKAKLETGKKTKKRK